MDKTYTNLLFHSFSYLSLLFRKFLPYKSESCSGSGGSGSRATMQPARRKGRPLPLSLSSSPSYPVLKSRLERVRSRRVCAVRPHIRLQRKQGGRRTPETGLAGSGSSRRSEQCRWQSILAAATAAAVTMHAAQDSLDELISKMHTEPNNMEMGVDDEEANAAAAILGATRERLTSEARLLHDHAERSLGRA